MGLQILLAGHPGGDGFEVDESAGHTVQHGHVPYVLRADIEPPQARPMNDRRDLML